MNSSRTATASSDKKSRILIAPFIPQIPPVPIAEATYSQSPAARLCPLKKIGLLAEKKRPPVWKDRRLVKGGTPEGSAVRQVTRSTADCSADCFEIELLLLVVLSSDFVTLQDRCDQLRLRSQHEISGLVERSLLPSVFENHRGPLVGYHDSRRVRIAGRNCRHDRSINDPQAAKPYDTKTLIDDSHMVVNASHSRRSHRVKDSRPDIACGLRKSFRTVTDRRSREVFLWPERPQRFLPHQASGHPDSVGSDVTILVGRQIVRRDDWLGCWISRPQTDRAAGGGTQVARRDRDRRKSMQRVAELVE